MRLSNHELPLEREENLRQHTQDFDPTRRRLGCAESNHGPVFALKDTQAWESEERYVQVCAAHTRLGSLGLHFAT